MGELYMHADIGLDRAVCIKETFKRLHIAFVVCLTLSVPVLYGQTEIPEWCRALPRPEYGNLQRIPASDPWFEVYKVAPAVYAIYEPHQSEEVISYLIVGDKRAMLFDTGMGISDLREITAELTRLPIVVLNSHTHNDHVGNNWQFETIYGMDTDFTRENARGSRDARQAEAPAEPRAKTRKPKSRPIRFAGICQRDLTRRPTRPGPGRSRHLRTMVTESIWAADR